MCDICEEKECLNELKHMIVDMLWKRLKIKYPNLEIDMHLNSLHVIKDGNVNSQVLKIGFTGDTMHVWRCIPRYSSGEEKIYAADPECIDKIFDVLEGRRPKWN